MAQALVKFLDNQYIECDGEETKFVSGIFGIFGHGCVVGVGQALEQGAIRTYAMTGAYPQSLDELLTDYGISYDHSKFIVEYVPNGSNLLPSVSVLTLNSSEGGAS